MSSWWHDNWQAISATGTGIAALSNVFKGVRQFHQSVWSSMLDALRRPGLRRRFDVIEGTLNEILAQMKPNSGGSIRDALNRIERETYLQGERIRIQSLEAEEGWKEFDANGALIACNRTYMRMVGRSWDELRGYNWLQVIDPRDEAIARNRFDDMIKHKREIQSRYRVVKPDGSTIRLDIRTTVMQSPKGEVLGFMAFAAPVEGEELTPA